MWDGFAYDREAYLVYVGTGNAEPWVQNFRVAENVDNLYACSIRGRRFDDRKAQMVFPDRAQRQLGFR